MLYERIVGGKILYQLEFLLQDRGQQVDLLTQDHGQVARGLGAAWLQRRQRVPQGTAGLHQRIGMGQQPGTGQQDVTGEPDIGQGDVLYGRMEVGVVGWRGRPTLAQQIRQQQQQANDHGEREPGCADVWRPARTHPQSFSGTVVRARP